MQEYKVEWSEEQKEKIINESLPFIKYTAYRLGHRLPPPLSMNDLVSIGIMGLLDALQRYAEGRVKIKTFVEYRIKGAMLDELRSHDGVSRSLKNKVNQIKSAHRKLEKELGRLPDEEEVAKSLNMTLDNYYRTLQTANNAAVFSLEDFKGKMKEENEIDIMECIPDPTVKTPLELMEENSSKTALANLINDLPEKEKLILSLYYWEELTMKEIGKVMSITEGRVCQLHSQALSRLKDRMEVHVSQ
jgi:RNA polymerase sigma factor for flagellar operon FliA